MNKIRCSEKTAHLECVRSRHLSVSRHPCLLSTCQSSAFERVVTPGKLHRWSVFVASKIHFIAFPISPAAHGQANLRFCRPGAQVLSGTLGCRIRVR